jgi:hypothetical protein
MKKLRKEKVSSFSLYFSRSSYMHNFLTTTPATKSHIAPKEVLKQKTIFMFQIKRNKKTKEEEDKRPRQTADSYIKTWSDDNNNNSFGCSFFFASRIVFRVGAGVKEKVASSETTCRGVARRYITRGIYIGEKTISRSSL